VKTFGSKSVQWNSQYKVFPLALLNILGLKKHKSYFPRGSQTLKNRSQLLTGTSSANKSQCFRICASAPLLPPSQLSEGHCGKNPKRFVRVLYNGHQKASVEYQEYWRSHYASSPSKGLKIFRRSFNAET